VPIFGKLEPQVKNTNYEALFRLNALISVLVLLSVSWISLLLSENMRGLFVNERDTSGCRYYVQIKSVKGLLPLLEAISFSCVIFNNTFHVGKLCVCLTVY
jgi:hypothetical protein